MASSVNAGKTALFEGESFREFYEFTERRILGALRSGDTLLDIGCGDGLLTERLVALGALKRAVGVEKKQSAINAALRRASCPACSFLAGDAEDVAFIRSLGKFDVILLRTVAHHFKNPLASLRVFQRMLKPRGRLILIDIDRESAFLEIFAIPLTLIITWVAVCRCIGIRKGLRAVRDMRYPSKDWREHRRVDIAHRKTIGWYKYSDIKKKLQHEFPGARYGRIGAFLGLGGVHFMVYEQEHD